METILYNVPVSIDQYNVPVSFDPNVEFDDAFVDECFRATPEELQERLVRLLISDIDMADTDEEKQRLNEKLDEVLNYTFLIYIL